MSNPGKWIALGATALTLTGAPESFAEGVLEDSPPEIHSSQSALVSSGTEDGSWSDRFGANFYSVFYGPALESPGSAYQPTPQGDPSNIPVLSRNFATLSYAFDANVGISATQYFLYVPVQGTQLALRDPYARAYIVDLLGSDTPLSWYADVRVHLPLSSYSKSADLQLGLQTFQAIAYPVGRTPLTLGVIGSARTNFYGSLGIGNDLELYAGPNLAYRLNPKVSLVVIYDTEFTHAYREDASTFTHEGSDFQPGVSWDITPTVNLNPFINIYSGKNTSLKGSSFGFTLSWILL